MLTKVVTYEDFNGETRTEELRFNLTKVELTKMAMDLPEDMRDSIPDDPSKIDNEKLATTLVEKLGNKGIFAFIEAIVLKSYGIKSEDGRRFIKTPEMAVEFSQTLAFDAIMMEFMANSDAAAEFINNVIPANVVDQIADSIPGPQVVPNN